MVPRPRSTKVRSDSSRFVRLGAALPSGCFEQSAFAAALLGELSVFGGLFAGAFAVPHILR